MQFKSRPLLRTVATVLGGLVLGVIAVVVVLAVGKRSEIGSEMLWIYSAPLILPAFYVARMINDSFSVLEVDERGVRVRKVLGGSDLDWNRIASILYGERIQVINGSRIREYSIELLGADGKRLIRLKSTFDREAYVVLMDQARARGIRVQL
ncbi:MAG TPA: hypothetical protein VKW04_03095 [Planctomycetota bacterium]|nr:hypothetical protein [Planctomycetota bacterium]